MKYISLKGLILSGITYVIVALILSILIPNGIYSLLNVECGQDMQSVACQSYISQHFGPSFLVLSAINAAAIAVSIGVLANYSTKISLKPNYAIFLFLNIAFIFSYLNANSIYESISEAVLILLIVVVSYKYTSSNINTVIKGVGDN